MQAGISPLPAERRSLCSYCDAANPIYACGVCRAEWYCSLECFEDHYPTHFACCETAKRIRKVCRSEDFAVVVRDLLRNCVGFMDEAVRRAWEAWLDSDDDECKSLHAESISVGAIRLLAEYLIKDKHGLAAKGLDKALLYDTKRVSTMVFKLVCVYMYPNAVAKCTDAFVCSTLCMPLNKEYRVDIVRTLHHYAVFLRGNVIPAHTVDLD